MNLLSVHEAQERILSDFKPVEAETSPLTACAGRVLAEDDPFLRPANFSMIIDDGFAVRAGDLVNATANAPLV